MPVSYLSPALPRGLRRVTIPIVAATMESLDGYGFIIDNPDDIAIEIVRWPMTSFALHSKGTRDAAFIPTFGTKAYSPLPARRRSSTGKGVCTRACQ